MLGFPNKSFFTVIALVFLSIESSDTLAIEPIFTEIDSAPFEAIALETIVPEALTCGTQKDFKSGYWGSIKFDSDSEEYKAKKKIHPNLPANTILQVLAKEKAIESIKALAEVNLRCDSSSCSESESCSLNLEIDENSLNEIMQCDHTESGANGRTLTWGIICTVFKGIQYTSKCSQCTNCENGTK